MGGLETAFGLGIMNQGVGFSKDAYGVGGCLPS
jgi:hypothetical protein